MDERSVQVEERDIDATSRHATLFPMGKGVVGFAHVCLSVSTVCLTCKRCVCLGCPSSFSCFILKSSQPHMSALEKPELLLYGCHAGMWEESERER